ncbi:MAG: hypothetical protein KME35_07315 [Aphanocapsa sp. GSE-SYN-MK-11-07L]|jgi:hypothetical protein|nr:hypothetical protein [Aphanocapsa sp. GSE-SYN-MK-11-07L]
MDSIEKNQIQKCLELRSKLESLLTNKSNIIPKSTSLADIVISHIEINHKHGTGILLQRIFTDSTHIFAVRSRDMYDGENYLGFGSTCLSHAGLSRAEVFQHVLQGLKTIDAERAICIPYYPDDVLSAIAVKEIYGIPLCTYIMDDQNVYSDGISDQLMRELLVKSSLRLAISPEIRDVYESKYKLKFWLLPAVVNRSCFQTSSSLPNSQKFQAKTGILIGNIWSNQWFSLLRETIQHSGVELDWYGNNSQAWLNVSDQQLRESGIHDRGYVQEEELIAQLRNHPYAIVPSGTLDERDDRQEIGLLSLPSRIPFIMTASQTPIIVLGSQKTAAARFVERFQVGVVSDYNSEGFRQAIDYVCSPIVNMAMRKNAATVSSSLASDDTDEWIWESLSQGAPADLRFEQLFADPPISNPISDLRSE